MRFDLRDLGRAARVHQREPRRRDGRLLLIQVADRPRAASHELLELRELLFLRREILLLHAQLLLLRDQGQEVRRDGEHHRLLRAADVADRRPARFVRAWRRMFRF